MLAFIKVLQVFLRFRKIKLTSLLNIAHTALKNSKNCINWVIKRLGKVSFTHKHHNKIQIWSKNIITSHRKVGLTVQSNNQFSIKEKKKFLVHLT